MKKMFEDYTLAIIFFAICCGIAAVMGLIKARDNQRATGGDKRRPLGPTAILVYTAEWIRKITHKVIAVFHPATQDRVRQVSHDELNEILKNSAHFRRMYSEAMRVSLDNLDDPEETCDPIIITD